MSFQPQNNARMGKLNHFWNIHHAFQGFQSTRNTQLIASLNRQNVQRAITTSTSSAFCRLNGQHSSGTPRKLIQIPFSQPLPINFWHSFWQKIHKLLPQRGHKPTQETSCNSVVFLLILCTRDALWPTLQRCMAWLVAKLQPGRAWKRFNST